MSGGAITAVGETLGWDTALIVAFVVVADYIQLRFLGYQIKSVSDSLESVESRTERLESQFIAPDGGERKDE